MKVSLLKQPLFISILFFFIFVFLISCGQKASSTDISKGTDSLNLTTEIPVATADSVAIIPSADTIANADIAKQVIKTNDDKKIVTTKKTTTEQTVVTTTTPVSTTANVPVVQPKPVVVANTPEPVKPVALPEPKPVEPIKPVVVVVPTDKTTGDWEVPSQYKSMTSPFANDKESIALGKSLYFTHCKSCHGSKGEGNGPKASTLDTEMRSFLNAGFKAQSQGEVYYKSMIGRKEMPKFLKKIPDAEEQWALVNYIKSF